MQAQALIYKFTVFGPPVGKMRPRVTWRGTFTPAPTRKYERAVRNWARLCLPWGWPLNRRYKLLVEYTGKPDNDNVLKSVQDALQGVCYKNDNQVEISTSIRLPESEPKRTIVTIEVLSDGGPPCGASGTGS